MFFKIAEKVANKLSYFCEKFCHVELSKIAQTGHTGSNSPALKKNSKRITGCEPAFKI